MISHDSVRSSYDSCVYLKKHKNGSLLYLFLYVDDMLVTCNSLFEVVNLKELLSSEFNMKDLGEAKKILRIEILRDRAKDVLYFRQKFSNASPWKMLKVCLLLYPLISNCPRNFVHKQR